MSSVKSRLSSCERRVRKLACKSGDCKISPKEVCRAVVLGKSNPGSLNHDFPKTKGLNIRSSVYVPDTVGISKRIKPSEHVKRAKEVEKEMRRFFGGTTSVKGLGTWEHVKCPRGVCRDNLLIVESYAPEVVWNKHDIDFQRFLNKKRKQWKQASLAFEWENLTKDSPYEGMHFIEED